MSAVQGHPFPIAHALVGRTAEAVHVARAVQMPWLQLARVAQAEPNRRLA